MISFLLSTSIIPNTSSSFTTNTTYINTTFSSPIIQFPRNSNFISTKHYNTTDIAIASSSSSSSSSISSDDEEQSLGLLLEVDGVVIDVYRSGNRQAFNEAFKKLGLDCANWSEPVYLDLVRKTGADEEMMLLFFFNRIGWPSSLPSNERDKFMKRLLLEKTQALDHFAISALPLRPGLQDFIDEACKQQVPVIILTAYCKCGDIIARSISEKLGHDRLSKVTIVGKEEVDQSLYARLVSGNGLNSGVDEQLANEAIKAVSAEKQRIAAEVASMLQLRVDIDTSSTESLQKIVASLHAGAEYAKVPVRNCVLIAGSQAGVSGANRVGMPCVVLRSSLTSGAEFPSAHAVMDGYGGADLTISKLQGKMWS